MSTEAACIESSCITEACAEEHPEKQQENSNLNFKFPESLYSGFPES